MKSTAERQRAFRERMRKAGLVKVEVWVRPELADRVRKYVARLSVPQPESLK